MSSSYLNSQKIFILISLSLIFYEFFITYVDKIKTPEIVYDKISDKQWNKSDRVLNDLVTDPSSRLQSTTGPPILESNCDAPFISINDRGRLGNQVCQFMSLYLFKIEFGIRIVVSAKMNKILRKTFDEFQVPHLPNLCFNTTGLPSESLMFTAMFEKFKANSLSEWKLNASNFNYFGYINNFPCQIDMMMKYRDKYRSVLKIKEMYRNTSMIMLENALKVKGRRKINTTLICVHVRRSDYINYSAKNNLVFPTKTFYKNAFEFYRKNCRNSVFVVVSDDVGWCRKQLSAPDVIILGNGNISFPELDFTLLTLCHHHIIDLGTFGRTSAFLGNGSAVVFRRRQKGSSIGYSSFDLLKRNFSCSSSSEFIYVD